MEACCCLGLACRCSPACSLARCPDMWRAGARLTSLGDAGERTTGSGGGTRMRSILVMAQVTISFVLLICAGLMLHSLYNLLSIDPGFKTADVLSMQVPLNWTKYQKERGLHELLPSSSLSCRRRCPVCRVLRYEYDRPDE